MGGAEETSEKAQDDEEENFTPTDIKLRNVIFITVATIIVFVHSIALDTIFFPKDVRTDPVTLPIAWIVGIFFSVHSMTCLTLGGFIFAIDRTKPFDAYLWDVAKIPIAVYLYALYFWSLLWAITMIGPTFYYYYYNLASEFAVFFVRCNQIATIGITVSWVLITPVVFAVHVGRVLVANCTRGCWRGPDLLV